MREERKENKKVNMNEFLIYFSNDRHKPFKKASHLKYN